MIKKKYFVWLKLGYLSNLAPECKRDKGLFNAELHFVNINYNGESNSTIGFEMLEGLQTGIYNRFLNKRN